MMQHSSPAPVQGPAFVRLLARLAGEGRASAATPLADRLGQWVDWNRAVVLAGALDGRLPEPEAEPLAFDAEEIERECTLARQALVQAIGQAPELAPGPAATAAVSPPDFAAFGKRHATLQQSMLAATGRLRGRLRDLLAARPAPLRRLAELDAAMERVLGPREYALLAMVPDLLERRFLHLRGHAQAPADDIFSASADATAGRTWLDLFRHDMRAVLLSELDVRFHPIEGLLEALRTR